MGMRLKPGTEAKLKKQRKAMERRVQLAALKAVERSTAKGHATAVDLLISQDADFTGLTRQSMAFIVDRGRIRGKVWNRNKKYGKAVEYGFPAKFVFPPPEALIPWVNQKLGKTGKEAEDVAWLVARKIYNRGRPAKPFMRPSQKVANAFFKRSLAKRLSAITR